MEDDFLQRLDQARKNGESKLAAMVPPAPILDAAAAKELIAVIENILLERVQWNPKSVLVKVWGAGRCKPPLPGRGAGVWKFYGIPGSEKTEWGKRFSKWEQTCVDALLLGNADDMERLIFDMIGARFFVLYCAIKQIWEKAHPDLVIEFDTAEKSVDNGAISFSVRIMIKKE